MTDREHRERLADLLKRRADVHFRGGDPGGAEPLVRAAEMLLRDGDKPKQNDKDD